MRRLDASAHALKSSLPSGGHTHDRRSGSPMPPQKGLTSQETEPAATDL